MLCTHKSAILLNRKKHDPVGLLQGALVNRFYAVQLPIITEVRTIHLQRIMSF